MNNGDWLHSNRQGPRQGYVDESGPTDANWAETGPFIDDILGSDEQYTGHFEDPSFSPTPQRNGQNGYRGRVSPQSYKQSHVGAAGGPQQAVDPLGSPFDSIRTSNARHNGANGSWPDLSNAEPRRSNPSLSLQESHRESRREILSLKHRITDLGNQLAEHHLLESKVAELEKVVVKLNGLAENHSQWEERFKNLMEENNETISGWLQGIKATVERFMVADTRLNGGSGRYPRSVIWDNRIEGDDEEDQAMPPLIL